MHWLTWLLAAAFAGITGYTGFALDRTNYYALLTAFSVFFFLYGLALSFSTFRDNHRWLWITGLTIRGILLFSVPNLSDDVYRFIWDGRLLVAGIHPFRYTPEHFQALGFPVAGLSEALFGRLNSPAYYTVYPGFCQLVFALAAFVFPGWDRGAIFFIKACLFACEIGSMRLLKNGVFKRKEAFALYALNPLAVMEITGNCHFEGAVIFFLLLAYRRLHTGSLWQSSLYWALAVASKMTPLLFLPLVWRFLGFRKGAVWMLWFTGFSILLFLPLLNTDIVLRIAGSLDLYFRQFQFNASIYYLVREIGRRQSGWDYGVYIGPALAAVSVIAILLCAIWAKRRLPEMLFLAAFLHLHGSAAVHPWYVLIPFLWSLNTRWHAAVLWTFTAVFSYSHYHANAYQEQFGWILAEYLLVWSVWLGELVFMAVARKRGHKSV